MPPFVYNACQPSGFKSAVYSSTGSLDQSGSGDGDTAPAPNELLEGKTLYAKSCAGCHGDISVSNKVGRSPFAIDQAIRTLSAMNHLANLSSVQIANIATALGYNPTQVDQCKGRRDSDINALFRLNKNEYIYTINDLFGLIPNTISFPPDNDGEKFANDAASLAMVSPELLEQYVYSAEDALKRVMILQKSLVMICSPPQTLAASCANQILDYWGRKILRRPLMPAEKSQLLLMINVSSTVSSATFEAGIQTALKAMLVSPQFLFRSIDRGSASIKTLTDFELATRLSYFLWSSTPDDALLDIAASGTLKQPAVLKAQVLRMLADPKSRRLSENFALRWLGLHRLKLITPSQSVYPTYNFNMQNSMIDETRLSFHNIVTKNLNPKELLTADYTFVNEQLAQHYGLSGVTGVTAKQVSLGTTPRRGLLSHASILTLTSHPDDSSVVLRGKWVLENMLCDPPPPPPPDVISALPPETINLTKRERIEAHRNNPACFSCHSKMDPIGFGLENFDGIGGYRLSLGGKPVDNLGVLPNGQSFTSAQGLGSYLAQSNSYSKCVSQKLVSYAVGRVLGNSDDCNVEEVAKKVSEPNSTFSDLIESIVMNDLFLKVQGK